MQGETAVEEVKAEPGDQQGVDAQIRSREPLQVSILVVVVVHVSKILLVMETPAVNVVQVNEKEDP